MLAGRKILQAVDRLTQEIAALGQRLATVQAQLQTQAEAPPAAKPREPEDFSAYAALADTLKGLSAGLASEREHNAKLITSLLDRAGRAAFAGTASELGRRGARKKNELKLAAETDAQRQAQAQWEAQREAAAAACEECKAALFGVQPAHANDMMKHSREKHAALVLPMLQAELTPVLGTGFTNAN